MTAESAHKRDKAIRRYIAELVERTKQVAATDHAQVEPLLDALAALPDTPKDDDADEESAPFQVLADSGYYSAD